MSGRTFLLCWVAAKNGIEAVSKWHDPAGFTILSICFFVLWGLAHFISGISSQGLQPSKGSAPMPFPRRLVIGLGAWLLFTVLGTEVWYRAHETRGNTPLVFRMAGRERALFRCARFRMPSVLKFDEGRAASWMDSDGSRWTAFFLSGTPGPPRSRILARCAPSGGLPACGRL